MSFLESVTITTIAPAVLLALALGYLLGSIPFGLLFVRAAGLGDIRSVGSGNIGATNVLRTGNKGLALATLLADALKGTAAILIARYLAGDVYAMAAGLGAFLGHLFPVWLRFKGGKGVATYIGVLLGLNLSSALLFCLIWLAMAVFFRISSLAALTASLVVPFVIALDVFHNRDQTLVFIVLSILVWIKHRANIARILDGTEPKIGGAKGAAPTGGH